MDWEILKTLKLRRSRSCIVLLAVLFSMLPAVVQAQFTFITNADNSITLTRYAGNDTDVVIPDSNNGHPVTGIGWGAFTATNIISVTIPDSITSISGWAFANCTRLTSVTIGSGATNVGTQPFYDCSNINTLTLGCPSIKGWFSGLPLTNVIFLNSVADIDSYAFSWCSNLTSVTIPNSVTSLGRNVFAYCSGLTNAVIGNGVTNLDYQVFSDCSSLASVTIVGSGSTRIGYQAFYGCSALTNLIIGTGVTRIDGDAFDWCSSLTSVSIPDSATNIGYAAFGACLGLTNISVALNNPAYRSLDGVLFDAAQMTLIEFPGGLGGSYTIPNTVISIGTHAFAGCSGLMNVMIPNSVISIGSYAFADCFSLTNVTIGDGITSIGEVAFADCYSLTNVAIPNSVTNIGYSAFSDCSHLASIVIGNGVTSIGSTAFANCPLLNSVLCFGDVPSFVDSTVFRNSSETMVYYLPNTSGWMATLAGRPTALWLPQMQTPGKSFGAQTNQFGFNLNWASGQTVVVEACTNLFNPDWQPVQTNTLTTGPAYFSDPQWTNYPGRFYRLRSL